MTLVGNSELLNGRAAGNDGLKGKMAEGHSTQWIESLI
jgi:hypothetical protein